MPQYPEFYRPSAEDRAIMIEIVNTFADASPEFLNEVAHFMTIEEREYAYDELSALFDIEARNEEKGGDEHLLSLARAVLILIGFYRVMPDYEIAQTIRSGGGRVWNFKRGGMAYTTDQIAEEWQFPEDDATAEARP